MISKLTIISPGLLGASIAMAARERNLAKTINIWARRPEVVTELDKLPWCDHATTDLTTACQNSELIILCAPVIRIIELCQRIAPLLNSTPIITDVGSVKADICRECIDALGPRAQFIGSHPMAGSEKTGLKNGQADLFQGKSCFITPTEESTPSATQTIAKFWQDIGSTVFTETPESHDTIVAQISHLPHVLAAALASYLAGKNTNAHKLCGNGLKDTTRIASGSPELWQEIISQNRKEILSALDQFQTEINTFKTAIQNDDAQETITLLSRGKKFRDQI